MKTNKKVVLDELDLKVLQEFTLISDVLTSTINKLTRMFTPIYQSILEYCNNNIPSGWEIEKKVSENIIYPFSDVDGREKVTSLINYFQIKNSIIFIQKEDKKWINYFEVSFGLFYSPDWEEYKIPIIYFNINKNPSPRFKGPLHSLNFYKSLLSSYKDLNVNIEHPEKGDEEEQIEVLIDFKNIDQINMVEEMFISDILPKYIKDIRNK